MTLRSRVSLTKNIWKHKQVHIGGFVGPLCFLLLPLRIRFLSSGRNSMILPLLSGKYASMSFECVKLYGENEYIFGQMVIWVLEI